MSKKVYYRVATKKNNLYISIVARGACRVIMKIGETSTAPEWLQEKGYYLTVFNTLREAKEFAGRGKFIDINAVILKCKIRGVIKNLPPMKSWMQINRHFTKNHFDKMEEDKHGWPYNTIMAKFITPIEEVR